MYSVADGVVDGDLVHVEVFYAGFAVFGDGDVCAVVDGYVFEV